MTVATRVNMRDSEMSGSKCKISGYRCGVVQVSDLLVRCTASVSGLLPTAQERPNDRATHRKIKKLKTVLKFILKLVSKNVQNLNH